MSNAEDELNCAEEILDAISAGLPMERTDFDCIGDYITAVVKATRSQHLSPQPLTELIAERFEAMHSDGCAWISTIGAAAMVRGIGEQP